MSCHKIFSRTAIIKLLNSFISFVGIVLVGFSVHAAEITLGWDPNTEADLAGYNIYYGNASRTYSSPIDVGSLTSYTVTGLEQGQTYFFAATAYDTNGNESDYSAEVSATIPLPNQPPVANDGSFSTSENIQTNGILSAVDADGDTLTYTLINNGSKGTARLIDSQTGSFTYSPNSGITGTDTFTFKVNDGKADSNTATVTVSINVVTIDESMKNLVWDPVLEEDIAGYKVYYGTASQTYGVPVDVGSQTSFSLDGFDVAQTYYFAVKAYNTAGVESDFSEELVWTNSGSTPPANHPPVATIGNLEATEDTVASGTLTASDADGDALIYTVVSNGTKGTVIIPNASAGTFSYSPLANATGMDSFTFKVNDGNVDSSVATVSININAINDTPTITGTPATIVAEGTTYGFTPTAADIDEGDTLTFSIVNKPPWATLNTSHGALTGTPGNDDIGTTSGIIITVTDSSGANASLPAFNLTVTNVNNAPIISGTPTTSIAEGSAYSFTPTASDPDAGDTLTFSITNKPSWAVFNIADGSLTGTPGNEDLGITSGIIITTTDSSGANASLTAFNLAVTNYVKPGDVNDSGTIDLVDLFLVQQLLAGITPETTIYPAADVNGDGKIGTVEMEYIKSYVAPQSDSGSSSSRIEAESGSLISPMQIVSSSETSGEGYIQTTTSSSGTATYSFNIDIPGTYKIIARVYATDASTDSFYVQIDNQEEDIWDLNPEDDSNKFNVWWEDEVTKRGTGTYDNPQYDPLTIEFTSGIHTIRFRGREAYTRLDSFYFSN